MSKNGLLLTHPLKIAADAIASQLAANMERVPFTPAGDVIRPNSKQARDE